MPFDVTPPGGPPQPERPPPPPWQPPAPRVPPPAPPLDAPPVASAPPVGPALTHGLPQPPAPTSPSPPPTKPKRWPLVVGAIVVVAIIGGALSGGGDTSGGGSNDAGSSGSGNDRAAVGQPVELGSMTFTVLSVYELPGDEFIAPEQGNRFLGVQIEAVNNGDESEVVSSLAQFSLRDGTGQRYDQALTTSGSASLDGDVLPGGRLRGEIVYEVPLTATALELVISDPFRGAVSVQLT